MIQLFSCLLFNLAHHFRRFFWKQMALSEQQSLRLLHLSDTHNLHRSIEKTFGSMPDADVLLHTGDFSNYGTPQELMDFNEWLGSVKHRYRHIVVIPGNHDWMDPLFRVGTKELSAAYVATCQHMRRILTNARFLFNEVVEIEGLRIYGCGWEPYHPAHAPDGVETRDPRCVAVWQATGPNPPQHRYDEIPQNVNVLMTHCPARYILDEVEGSGSVWGSSKQLRRVIEEKTPQVHLFGHLHEQRGVWVKQDNGSYAGGVEFLGPDNVPLPVRIDPHFGSKGYPCDVMSCNAMQNHGGVDGKAEHIAGPPRLIIAQRGDSQAAWSFTVPTVQARKRT